MENMGSIETRKEIGEKARKEDHEMKPLIALMVAVTLAFGLVPNAEAKDEFERGFKMELGAISARAAVGFGVGLVEGIVHGGPSYEYRPYCEPVRIERHIIVRPPRQYWRWHHMQPRHPRHHRHHRMHHYRCCP